MDLKQDELQFHNPLHRKILAEAEAHLHDPNFTADLYFLAHPDPTTVSYTHLDVYKRQAIYDVPNPSSFRIRLSLTPIRVIIHSSLVSTILYLYRSDRSH